MTAKELKENAKRIGKLANNYTQPDYYYFLPDKFNDFVEQLCKEQRHECQIERNKRSKYIDGIWYVACEDVLNTEMPDL